MGEEEFFAVYEETYEPPTIVRAEDAEQALEMYAEATGGILTRVKLQEDGSVNAVVLGGASFAGRERGLGHSLSAVELNYIY